MESYKGLKVAGRFNSKLGDLGRRLGSYDTAITHVKFGRDLGINSEFITQKEEVINTSKRIYYKLTKAIDTEV